MGIQAPKGTKDVVPSESYKWQYVEQVMRRIAGTFGYCEVRTPVIEHTELFLRGVGGTTDIVQKEMYTFEDKGGRSISLKPEGTAGVVRQYIENHLYAAPQPTKMYYLNCPVFRYERPQAGRLREHHQFGVEVFGAPDASADAEIILLAITLLKELGVGELALHINSIGCGSCRPRYQQALRDYFAKNLENMCADCKARFETNPLRLLDCKVQQCAEYAANAPRITDYICDDCRGHFEELQGYLKAAGVAHEIDPRIVRGLDYYTKTVFEIISNDIGAQGTVCGGGRYDRLIEEIGGPSEPGVGFGMGMERLLIVLENAKKLPQPPSMCDIYLAHYGSEAKRRAFELAFRLRARGVPAEVDHCGRSMKAQFKYAGKLGARYVGVIGEDELRDGVIRIKNMADSTETLAELDAFAESWQAI